MALFDMSSDFLGRLQLTLNLAYFIEEILRIDRIQLVKGLERVHKERLWVRHLYIP